MAENDTIDHVDSPPQKHTAGIPIDAHFDEAFADALARLESYNKHHYRPNSYLHKWWARRCGSTFRLILKGLVANSDQRSYYVPGGLEGKIILDPMIGGGTTLHEAIRLGANVIGVDIDPIPVLQARATLSAVPLHELEAGFSTFFHQLQEALTPYTRTCCPDCDHGTWMWYTLYGLRRRCRCGPALVVDSFLLRQEQSGATWALCPVCGLVVKNGMHQCLSGRATRLVEKTQPVCSTCSESFRDEVETPFYRRYEPLAVAGRCPVHGFFLKSPDLLDGEAKQRADERRMQLLFARADFAIEPGRKSQHLVNRGINHYLDLFSSRQLIYLARAIECLPFHEPATRLNLGLLLSTSLEFNSMLCSYKGKLPRRSGAVRHTFAHHAYAFPYTALEVNPVYPEQASGTLLKLFDSRIRRARQWAQRPRERVLGDGPRRFVELDLERDEGVEALEPAALNHGQRAFHLHQGTAARLPLVAQSVDAVVTDPPYYDSVQYSDLSAFFRVWLRQLLPDAADWKYDETDAAVDLEQNGRDGRYAERMAAIFGECRRVLKPERGRLIFTFHHWRPVAWAALTEALYRAGFMLLNCYVVHAEHPLSVHVANLRALTHDAILVLAAHDMGRGCAWERPERIGQQDGRQFCRECGQLLGWLLKQDRLTSANIQDIWSTTMSKQN
jgi:putative DNA methylase